MDRYLPLFRESDIPYKVFLDMDGVLVNSGPQIRKDKKSGKIWVDPKPWTEMPWMPKGKELLQFVKQYFKDIAILSSPGRDFQGKVNQAVIQGKKIWLDKNIPEIHKRLFTPEKEKYAGPHSILIDDKRENIRDWNNAGGIGLWYDPESFDAVIQELRKYSRYSGEQQDLF